MKRISNQNSVDTLDVIDVTPYIGRGRQAAMGAPNAISLAISDRLELQPILLMTTCSWTTKRCDGGLPTKFFSSARSSAM